MRAVALPAISALLAGSGGQRGIATYQPTGGGKRSAARAARGRLGSRAGGRRPVSVARQPIAGHYHPREALPHAIGGSVALPGRGLPGKVLSPGEALHDPAGTVQPGRVGPQGLRAVSSWAAAAGRPLRGPVAE